MFCNICFSIVPFLYFVKPLKNINRVLKNKKGNIQCLTKPKAKTEKLKVTGCRLKLGDDRCAFTALF